MSNNLLKPAGRGVCALVALVALASGAVAADADNGERLAKRWCASCHIVASDQRQGNTDAPPFASIAKKSNITAARLAFFLLDPHPKMPDMSLTRSEAADLAAYVVMQKK